MSIFKRFSSKKTNTKKTSDETLVLDENTTLSKESDSIESLDSITDSLSSLTEEERNIIESILQDGKTERSKMDLTLDEEIAVKAEELTVRSKLSKTTDEVLNDNSYQNALDILKGEKDDVDEIEPVDNIEEKFEVLTDISDTSDGESQVTNLELEPLDTESASSEPVTIEATNKDMTDLPSEIEADATETTITSEETVVEVEAQVTETAEPIEALKPSSLQDLEDLSPRTQPRVKLGEMRVDVARITSDIESGEALYRRAQQRVENLMNFVERAEVDFSLLDRLEPENRQLKSRNRTLTSDLDDTKSKVSSLTTSLEDLQRRFGDTQTELDTTNAKLAQTTQILDETERKFGQLKSENDDMIMRLERAKTDLEVETRENKNLRDRITEISEDLEKTNSDKLSNAKRIESLKIDLHDQTDNSDKLRAEVSDLRHALDESQKINTQMKGELASVHDEIRGFKTHYEYNVLKRDDLIADLESKIADLTDQVKLKDDIIESNTRDISVLRKERTAQDLERERLEKTITQQSIKLTNAEEEMIRSKHSMLELDQKYKNITAAFANNETRREPPMPHPAPDIRPPAAPTPAERVATTPAVPAPSAPAQAARMTVEGPEAGTKTTNVEDMIMDYKLGLRPNL